MQNKPYITSITNTKVLWQNAEPLFVCIHQVTAATRNGIFWPHSTPKSPFTSDPHLALEHTSVKWQLNSLVSV